jgi:hypothetical protein
MTLKDYIEKASQEFSEKFDWLPEYIDGKIKNSEEIKTFLRSQLEGLAKEMAQAVRVKNVTPITDREDEAAEADTWNSAVEDQDLKLKTFLGDIK